MATRINVPDSGSSSKSKATTLVVAFTGVIISIGAGLFISGAANILQFFIIIFGLIAFIVMFVRMDLGIIAMIIVLYTQAYIIVGERYGVTNVVQGLIMLLGLAMGTRWIVYSDEFPQGWMRPLSLIFFYCMVGLASVLIAQNQEVAMSVAVETIKSGIIAFMVAILITNARSLRLVIWGLLLIGIFLGSLSVFQFITSSYGNDYGGFAQAALQNITEKQTITVPVDLLAILIILRK